jgi:hypothetical protein
MVRQPRTKMTAATPCFNLTSHDHRPGSSCCRRRFMAGMTLPLFTYALLQRGAGERSIGRVYSANTVGAIMGVLLAVHVVMPAIGSEGPGRPRRVAGSSWSGWRCWRWPVPALAMALGTGRPAPVSAMLAVFAGLFTHRSAFRSSCGWPAGVYPAWDQAHLTGRHRCAVSTGTARPPVSPGLCTKADI